jgi:hypothetical protein
LVTWVTVVGRNSSLPFTVVPIKKI